MDSDFSVIRLLTNQAPTISIFATDTEFTTMTPLSGHLFGDAEFHFARLKVSTTPADLRRGRLDGRARDGRGRHGVDLVVGGETLEQHRRPRRRARSGDTLPATS